MRAFEVLGLSYAADSVRTASHQCSGRVGLRYGRMMLRRVERVNIMTICYTQHKNYSTEAEAAATTTSYVQNVSAADGATRSAFGQHPLKNPLIPSIR